MGYELCFRASTDDVDVRLVRELAAQHDLDEAMVRFRGAIAASLNRIDALSRDLD